MSRGLLKRRRRRIQQNRRRGAIAPLSLVTPSTRPPAPLCTSGKRSFKDMAEVREFAEGKRRDLAHRKRPTTMNACRAYRCACGMLHLTSKGEGAAF